MVHSACSSCKGLGQEIRYYILATATYEGEGVKKIPKMQITSQISEVKSMCNNFFFFAPNTITPDPSSSQWSKEEGVPDYFGIDTARTWNCAE